MADITTGGRLPIMLKTAKGKYPKILADEPAASEYALEGSQLKV